MQEGPLNWVPEFFAVEDYATLIEADTLNWIRLPLGYCRRHARLHCESDVKCLLCDRFAALPEDLPRLKSMHERFRALGLHAKAEAVAAQIHRLEAQAETALIPAGRIPIGAEALDSQTVEEQGKLALWRQAEVAQCPSQRSLETSVGQETYSVW
jgi:hypothetical protein